MRSDQSRLRHAQLFELLRQQSLSDKTTARLRARGFARAQIDRDEAAMIRAAAEYSWGPVAAVAGRG